MDESSVIESDVFWIPELLTNDELPDAYLKEWRLYLNKKNKKEVRDLVSFAENSLRFVNYSKRTVRFFAHYARMFLMPPEVLYLTIDIHDRYLVNSLGLYSQQTTENSFFIENDYKCRGVLVALSCMQIASKLSSTYNVLTMSIIAKAMAKIGYKVDKASIIRSELNVLRLVASSMSNVTVLTYVEMFLEDMNALLTEVKTSDLVQICIKIINVTYMLHNEIYTKFHYAFQKREIRTLKEKTQFLTIEGDLILLAASIVCTCATMYDPSDKLCRDMMSYLEQTTRYHANEINVLRNIITQIILRRQMLEVAN